MNSATITFVASRPGVNVEVTSSWLSVKSVVLTISAAVPQGESNTSMYVKISGITPSLTGDDSDEPKVWSIGPNSAGATFRLTSGLNQLKASLTFKDCGCYSESPPYLSAQPLQISVDNTAWVYAGVNLNGSDPSSVAGYESAVARQVGFGPGQTVDEKYVAAVYPIDSNRVTPPWYAILPGLSVISTTPSSPEVSLQGYTWQKKLGESITSFDTTWKDKATSFEFYSGILFGIAGGGVISFVVELANAIERSAKEEEQAKIPDIPERREQPASSANVKGDVPKRAPTDSRMQLGPRDRHRSMPPVWLGGLLGVVAAEWLRRQVSKGARR